MPVHGSFDVQPRAGHDRNAVYLAERALLQMVRNGDMDHSEMLKISESLSSGVPLRSADPLRQMKVSIVTFATLVSRPRWKAG